MFSLALVSRVKLKFYLKQVHKVINKHKKKQFISLFKTNSKNEYKFVKRRGLSGYLFICYAKNFYKMDF